MKLRYKKTSLDIDLSTLRAAVLAVTTASVDYVHLCTPAAGALALQSNSTADGVSASAVVPTTGTGSFRCQASAEHLLKACYAVRDDEVLSFADGTVESPGVQLEPLKADDGFVARPAIPESGSLAFAVPLAEWHNVIAAALLTASKDVSRDRICGVHFDPGEDGDHDRCVVATDGHRLLRLIVPWTIQAGFTVFRPALAVASQVLPQDGDASVRVGEESVEVSTPGVSVCMRRSGGRYPPWRKVVPGGTTWPVIVGADAFIDLVDRAAGLSDDRNHGVHLEISSGRMIVRSDPDQTVAGRWELLVEHAGPPLTNAWNGSYLGDLLRLLNGVERLTLTFGDDSLEPLAVTSGERPDFLAVIMPLRV